MRSLKITVVRHCCGRTVWSETRVSSPVPYCCQRRGSHPATLKHGPRGISTMVALRLFACSMAVFTSAAADIVPGSEASTFVRHPPHPRPCWVFSHMNKSGGMTVRKMMSHLMSRQGFSHGLFDDREWTSGTAFAEHFVQKNFSLSYGGYTEGLRAFGDGSCKWFTVFRHPVSRLVSAFLYCHKRPKDQLCATIVADAKDMTLLDFAKHWGNYGLRQFTLSFMSPEDVFDTNAVTTFCHGTRDRGDVCVPGWYKQKEYLASGRSADGWYSTIMPELTIARFLPKVEQIISKKYAAVGILERWEDTMNLFDAVLGIPGFSWIEQSKVAGVQNEDNRFRSVERDVLKGAWDDANVKQFIWLDLLLYDHAIAVHARQAGEQGVV